MCGRNAELQRQVETEQDGEGRGRGSDGERKKGKKHTFIQSFNKHSLGTYCVLGFESQRAGAAAAQGHHEGRDALCHVLTHPVPGTYKGEEQSVK